MVNIQTRARAVVSVKVQPRRISQLAISLLACAAPMSLAMAQYDAGATLDLGMGYGQGALSQSAMRIDPGSQNDARSDDHNYAGSGMARDVRLAALRKEYARRRASDGADSANAWAFETGRHDAHAERD